jgi:hypothetical protein
MSNQRLEQASNLLCRVSLSLSTEALQSLDVDAVTWTERRYRQAAITEAIKIVDEAIELRSKPRSVGLSDRFEAIKMRLPSDLQFGWLMPTKWIDRVEV